MRTWEYKIVGFIDEPTHARNMNKLGAEGWELVQFIPQVAGWGPSHDRAIFKRPTNEPDYAPLPRRVF